MAHGIRHVRTVEGEHFFGLPIGSPITEHLYLLKKAEHAGHVPKGLTTTKSSKVDVPNSGTPKASHPSLKGTGTFKISDAQFHAPSGSKVVTIKNQPGMKFVRTPDGTVHAFNSKGEVDLPDNIQNALQKKFTPNFAGDEKYGIEDLTEAKSPDEAKPELKDLPTGSILQDPEGNAVFTKQSDGDWKHEALGIDVANEDIQDDYESGDLSVQTKEEASAAKQKVNGHDFKNITAAETKEILDSDPVGTKYDIAIGDGSKSKTLEKQKDGTWSWVDDPESSFTSSTLSWTHDHISDHKEETPDGTSKPDESETVPGPNAPPVEKPAPHPEETTPKESPKAPQPESKKPDTTANPLESNTEEWNGKEKKSEPLPHQVSHKPSTAPRTMEDIKGKGGQIKAEEKPSEPEIPNKLVGKVSGLAKPEDIEALKHGGFLYTTSGNKYSVDDKGKMLYSSSVTGESINSSHTIESLKQHGNINLWVPNKEEHQTEIPKVEEPEPNIKGFKVGDTVPPGTDWYDQAPVGTEVTSSEGSYRKSSSGFWDLLTEQDELYGSGVGHTASGLSLHEYSLSKIPAPEKPGENPDLGSEDNPHLPKVGEHVLDVETAKQLPTGTLLTYTKKDGSTSSYAKLESGNFLTPGGGQITADAMKYSFKNKKLAVKSYPNVGNPEESLDPGHSSFVPGGQVYSDKDMQEALDSLQAHSGFQISYGLKAVPDNPIAKNADELKQAAVSAHPELKPKAAAIAFLKDKLGKSDEGDLKALKEKLGDESPKMSISAGDQKHEFSSNQMQKAVDILEGYNGKLFKNELTKQGSPLGQVDWNKAVGFHKDKTEGKQAVIDLLKKKIEAANQVAKASPESGGPSRDLSDGAQDLSSGPTVGDAPTSWEELDKLPVGAVLKSTHTGIRWEKQSDGSWVNDQTESKVSHGDNWGPLEKGSYKVISIENSKKSSPGVGDIVTELKDLDSLGAGSQIYNPSYDEKSTVWTKNVDGSWTHVNQDGYSTTVDKESTGLWNFLHSGNAQVKSIGSDVSPASSEEKLASALSTNNDSAIDLDKPLTVEEFKDLPIGSVAEFRPDSKQPLTYTYTKVDDNTWAKDGVNLDDLLFISNVKNGRIFLVSKPDNLPDYAKTPAAVLNKEPDFNSPDADIPAYNKSGLLPGKYSTKNGKAYMIVKSDGSGIYVNGSGDVQKILPGKVKANYTAGMNSYHGVVPEDQIPDVPDAPTVISVKMTKKAAGPVNLEDGTYFSGTAKDPMATVYEVSGDKVTIKKTDGSSIETTKNKLKTAFAGGKILDGDGNSVLPENHTGAMYLWGQATTGEAVVAAHSIIEDAKSDPEFSGIFSKKFQQKLALNGFIVPSEKLKQKISDAHGGDKSEMGSSYGLWWQTDGTYADNPWNTEGLQILQDQLSAFVDHIDTEHPENTASGDFQWTVNGEARMPLDIAAELNSYEYWNNSSLASAYKKISSSFGDGKSIGQVALSKQEKSSWLLALKKGQFSIMYGIEVNAAAKKGKVLPNGWKHPGYAGNTETHNITWGASINGELPAGADLGHEWSQGHPSEWSSEEVDNYLIKAQMQNPTYLSKYDKALWVTYHKEGGAYSDHVNKLSVQAALAKKNGEPELTDPPVWSDTVQPAKLYNKVFASAKNPDHITGDEWSSHASEALTKSWIQDYASDPDFKEWIAKPETQDWIAQNTSDYYWNYYGQADKKDPTTWLDTAYSSAYTSVIGRYYQSKYDAWHAEAMKPTFKHTGFIDNGSHPVYIDEDVNPDSPTFGKKYIFKPAMKKYIVEQDVAANKLSKMWGFAPPKAEVIYSHPDDGEMGFQQEFANKVGDLTKGHDTSLLAETQLNDLAKEHVLDWILDNDDSHGENFMVMQDGHLVGIDKSRAFKAYGQWKGLDPAAMNTNASLVYSDLYTRVQNKQFTKEQADKMYMAAIKAAQKIQKSSDSAVSSILLDGVKNRTSWGKADYMTWDHHSEPVTNAQELIDAVLDRKSHLVDDFNGLWKKLYDGNGWSLPEPPDKALGEEHLSGWEEADTIEKMEAAKTFGTPAIHGSGSIVGGHSLLWTEKDPNGNDLHYGQLKVGKLTGDDILATLSSKTDGASSMHPQSIAEFPDTSDWKHSISAAGKEATKNITIAEPEWDETVAQNFEASKSAIQKDLEHWSSDLELGDDGLHHFPSGNTVPADGLFQYKSALDHFSQMVGKVESAKTDKTPTSKQEFQSFTPIAYAKDPKQFSNGDRWYKQLSDGNFLYYDGQSVQVVNSVPEGVSKGIGGWSSNAIPSADPNTYEFHDAHLNAGKLSNGSLVHTGNLQDGSQGHEYRVVLPTGEEIRFRDHNATYTLKSQEGMINFKLNPEVDKAASLGNVQKYLESLGVDMSGADEQGAELNYWRQMFDRVQGSKGGGSKITAARAALEAKLEEAKAKLGKPNIAWYDTPEALSKVMTPEEELLFYRNLAEETWGAEKVSSFIANGDHLPQYQHMDLTNPGAASGHAWYKRIDLSKEDLEKKGHFIAVGNTGGDASTAAYLKSGGSLSIEERLRLLGFYKVTPQGTTDQSTGAGSSVFVRVAKDGAYESGALVGRHRVYYNPAVLSHIGTYSYGDDSYGNIGYLKQKNQFDVLSYLDSSMGSDNETLVPGGISLFDYMEVMAFDSPTERNEVIQQFKALGINELRGLPIEDRIVTYDQVEAARKKAKEQWAK